MAKNYTFNEAVRIIAEGKDLESITDIGRRYPVLAHKVAVVAAKAGEEFIDLMGYMPEYLTANKVNTAIKAGITESDSGDTEDENDTEAASEDAGDVDYESMSTKQLWDILGKAGLRKTAKSTKKGDLVAACKAMATNAGASVEAVDADDGDEEESTNPYEGKSAMDLFKECKKRGIKAPAKKTAKFYADMLTKDDAKETEAGDADGDWNEDEAEETPAEEKKPAKKATTAKSEKAPAKKAAAKKAEAEEDDDWDI